MGQVSGTEEFKCILIGESGVGKTTLVNLWRLEPRPEVYLPTAGIAQHVVHFKAVIHAPSAKYRQIRLVLHDVGFDVAESTLDKCLQNADVIVMVYDVLKPYTLDYLEFMWPRLLLLAKGSALFVLVGIKNDNSLSRRCPTDALLLTPRKKEIDVAYANVTSFAVERSANTRSLCYQILRRAYVQRHGNPGYIFEFLFDADKNESDHDSRQVVTRDGTVRTYRNQGSPSH